jgi:type IV pilus biogenesis protein CpaD/CtpE
MSRILWILLALLLGTILAGCAKDRLTVSAYTVQYIENEPVELKIEYEVK